MKRRSKEIILKVEEENFFMKMSSKERKEVEIWLKIQETKVSKKMEFLENTREILEKLIDSCTSEEKKNVIKLFNMEAKKVVNERHFLDVVKYALEKVNYDYWIATIEPSVTNGRIYYEEGKNVATGYYLGEWVEMAKNYWPKRESRLANKLELIIWYAWRIAKGYWTLEYVANDSSSAGNYWNSPDSAHHREKVGARVCGGFKDGQGNTLKLVYDTEHTVMLFGGFCSQNGYKHPVATAKMGYCSYHMCYNGSGVVVLLK